MEPARAVYLLRQVCHSLGEAHARGLIHRDIKPANIFLCRLGRDDDFVKVLDFGLVKQVDGGNPRHDAHDGRATAGTPAYMAPEIALGAPTSTARRHLLAGMRRLLPADRTAGVLGERRWRRSLAHVKDEPVPASSAFGARHPPLLDGLILESPREGPGLTDLAVSGIVL